MQEAIKKVYDQYGIDAEIIGSMLGISAELIKNDTCSPEDREKVMSLLNGFSIMEYKVTNEEVLHAVIERFLGYGLSIKTLAKLISVEALVLQDFYEGRKLALSMRYTISCRLFRLGNIVFS